jgi:hypothetical protein
MVFAAGVNSARKLALDGKTPYESGKFGELV